MKILALFLALAGSAAAQKNNELREIQRDIGLLSQDVRDLKAVVDKVSASSDQAAQNATKNGQTLQNLDRMVSDRMKEQEQRIVAPIATLNARVNEMGADHNATRDQIAELSAQLKKMQQQMKDLTDAVQILVTNAARPEPPKAPDAVTSASATPPTGLTPERLYADALTAKQGGQTDNALEQFKKFLLWYGNTDMAPKAQFHIGDIQYNQNKLDDARTSFDKVLTDYPEGASTADAMYMQGMIFLKQGQKDKAAERFRTVARRYPKTQAGKYSTEQLADLGLRPTAPVTPRKKR